SDPEFGDRTLVVAIPSAGRVEVGWRQGLPDTLTGYAPNSYTFTGVEFGPPTGRNLFPNGGLQTSFLDSRLAARLAAVSYLGITAALASDASPKIIGVSPRFAGFQVGASFSPDAEDPVWGGEVGASAQAGLLREIYFG